LFGLHNLILANAVLITSEQAGETKHDFSGQQTFDNVLIFAPIFSYFAVPARTSTGSCPGEWWEPWSRAASSSSGSAALLVAARTAQSFGAAIVTPAALSILTDAFPEGGGRGRAVGFWTAAQAGGGALGWILGGFLTQGPGWEWVFLSTVPAGILGVLQSQRSLRAPSSTGASASSLPALERLNEGRPA
jgi:MFS family permease